MPIQSFTMNITMNCLCQPQPQPHQDDYVPSPLQSSHQLVYQMIDGRNFYPVTDEDILSPIDISASWEESSPDMEATAMLVSLFSSTLENNSQTNLVQGPPGRHDTDGEISDNSSVSTDIFDGGYGNLAPNAVFFSNTQVLHPQNQHKKSSQQIQHHVSPLQPPSSRFPEAVMQAAPNPMISRSAVPFSALGNDDDDDDEEEVLSLSDLVSSQERRFKPFHEEKWSQRYEELLAFQQKHGHAGVPHTYPPNQQLARWIKRQRRQYKLLQDGKPTTLTQERQDMLSKVGFVWDSHEVNWYQKFESLLEYKRLHDTCNVPSNYGKDKKLATWIKCQRRQYKLFMEKRGSSMTTERVAELNKIGFHWEIRRVNATRSSTVNKALKRKVGKSSAAGFPALATRLVKMVSPSA